MTEYATNELFGLECAFLKFFTIPICWDLINENLYGESLPEPIWMNDENGISNIFEILYTVTPTSEVSTSASQM